MKNTIIGLETIKLKNNNKEMSKMKKINSKNLVSMVMVVAALLGVLSGCGINETQETSKFDDAEATIISNEYSVNTQITLEGTELKNLDFTNKNSDMTKTIELVLEGTDSILFSSDTVSANETLTVGNINENLSDGSYKCILKVFCHDSTNSIIGQTNTKVTLHANPTEPIESKITDLSAPISIKININNKDSKFKCLYTY